MLQSLLLSLVAISFPSSGIHVQSHEEEVIARFKQGILSRRLSINNCKFDVSMQLWHHAEIAGNTLEMKQYYKENPKLDMHYVFAIDRSSNRMRIVQQGDIVKNHANQRIEKVQSYCEYGYYDGIPVVYAPLDKNIYLSSANLQGSICTPDRQNIVATAAPGLLPVYLSIGMYPNPSLLKYPKDRYLPTKDILSPDLSNLHLEYAGEMQYENEVCILIRHKLNDNASNYIEYVVNKADSTVVHQISSIYSYKPTTVFTKIRYSNMHGINLPMSWRRHMYTNGELMTDASCQVDMCSINEQENAQAAVVKLNKNDPMLLTDPSSIDKKYIIHDSKISEYSSINVYYVLLAVLLCSVVVISLVVLRRKKQQAPRFTL